MRSRPGLLRVLERFHPPRPGVQPVVLVVKAIAALVAVYRVGPVSPVQTLAKSSAKTAENTNTHFLIPNPFL
jgi:hypothetical protein